MASSSTLTTCEPTSNPGALMQIRRANLGESDELTRVAHEAKRHWGYRAEDLAAWQSDLTVLPAALRTLPTFVADIEGQIAGFYQLSATGAALELEHFWVRPAHMRRGVGRALLAHAAREASASGFSELQIDADPHAEPFYLACGAVRSGERPAPIAGEPRRVRPQLVLPTHLFEEAVP